MWANISTILVFPPDRDLNLGSKFFMFVKRIFLLFQFDKRKKNKKKKKLFHSRFFIQHCGRKFCVKNCKSNFLAQISLCHVIHLRFRNLKRKINLSPNNRCRMSKIIVILRCKFEWKFQFHWLLRCNLRRWSVNAISFLALLMLQFLICFNVFNYHFEK